MNRPAHLALVTLLSATPACEDVYRALQPVPGEVTIVLLDLPMGVTGRHGEATAIIGPDGTLGLVDIGNSNHDDQVRDVVRLLNEELGRDDLQVDWVLLTHFHGDHIGALTDLLVDADEPLAGVRGVIHRGFVDLGEGMNEDDFEALCDGLRGSGSLPDVPLCQADEAPRCRARDRSEPYRATGCPGLLSGDLLDPDDDAEGQPAFVPLGGAARLSVVAADTFVVAGGETIPMDTFGHDDTNHENARSVVGQLSFGGFRYHLGGDLTGSGEPTEPDVESHLIEHAGDRFFGTDGVDVIHVHHHGRRTSSNSWFVDALAPADGRSRNVVAGINAAHVGSPHDEVVERWTSGGRLGAGRFCATHTPSGASPDDYPALVDSDGPVFIQTEDSGAGYRIWTGSTGWSERFETLR